MFEGVVIFYYSNFWFLIVVGNVLKFIYEGFVFVYVWVVFDNLKVLLMKVGYSFIVFDGKNLKLMYFKL